MNKHSIQIILPVYNEFQNLPITISKILKTRDEQGLNLKLVIVNDGSTDDTGSYLNSIYDSSFMKNYEFSENRGYSSAIKKGIELCDNSGFILLLDSDNQFDIFEINKFTPFLATFDIVVGKRSPRADNLSRVLLGKLWSIVGRLFFRTRIEDLNCGFKIFKASLLKDINLVSIGPGINLDIFSNTSIKNKPVKEINVRHYPRLNGVATGSSLKTIRVSLIDLTRITINLLFRIK
jgi:glycosyltransferase involved in cell wall biosynthesis